MSQQLVYVNQSAEDVLRQRREDRRRYQEKQIIAAEELRRQAEAEKQRQRTALSRERQEAQKQSRAELDTLRREILAEIPLALVRQASKAFKNGRLRPLISWDGRTYRLVRRRGRWTRLKIKFMRHIDYSVQEIASWGLGYELFMLSDGRLAVQGSRLLTNGEFAYNHNRSERSHVDGLWADQQASIRFKGLDKKALATMLAQLRRY